MRTINTKYGLSIVVNLDNFGDVILPSRFRDLAETIEEFNNTFTQNNVFLKAGQQVGKYIPIEFVQQKTFAQKNVFLSAGQPVPIIFVQHVRQTRNTKDIF
ncbi:hypothetical protein QE152_g23228 [Popillia japonica]|uniref:Uncharacterized protein n=1 Tax=Popillia japonica TaxID=7064 RepID=A0AAW1KG45_POPJA